MACQSRSPQPTGHRFPSTIAALGGALALAGALAGRPTLLDWGSTAPERRARLPGDDWISRADLQATRGITVHAAEVAVWPWVAQLGQGRGGFYSYDFLENLVGCDIHSATRVIPDLQAVRIGDTIRLAPEVGLAVVEVAPPSVLVLRGGVPIGGARPPFDFTWAFVLREEPGARTRLLVRERYRYLSWWVGPMVELVELVSFLMTQKMLREIRTRAESDA